MSEKQQKFTEDEYFIMDTCHYAKVEKDNFLGIMCMLSEDEEQSAAHKAKMAEYLKCKGKYITEQDILKKAHQITRKIEQYYRPAQYVKYIGDTTELLTRDKIYKVETVLGCEEAFLIRCDDDEFQEVPAELFEFQEVTKIKYIGDEDDDGKLSIADGFELNKIYDVEPLKMWKYKCDNGLSCWFYETSPIEFKKASVFIPKPFENIDDALRLLRDAIEFGDLTNLARHIHPECTYISQPANRELNTKIDFIKCWREVSQTQLAENVFCDCDFGKLEEVPEDSLFPVGTRCVISFNRNDYDVFLIKLNEERNFITGIYVYNAKYFSENHFKIKADYQENENNDK